MNPRKKSPHPVSRRAFAKTVGTAAASAFGFQFIPSRAWGQLTKPALAGIGSGGKGATDIAQSANAGFQIVALVDVIDATKTANTRGRMGSMADSRAKYSGARFFPSSSTPSTGRRGRCLADGVFGEGRLASIVIRLNGVNGRSRSARILRSFVHRRLHLYAHRTGSLAAPKRINVSCGPDKKLPAGDRRRGNHLLVECVARQYFQDIACSVNDEHTRQRSDTNHASPSHRRRIVIAQSTDTFLLVANLPGRGVEA